MFKTLRSFVRLRFGGALVAAALTLFCGNALGQSTTLATTPLYSASNVPANLMLALSVEFPTGTVAAYTDNSGNQLVYTDTSGNSQTLTCGGQNSGFGICYYQQMNYLGYFDYQKCYNYSTTLGYFTPIDPSIVKPNASTGSCIDALGLSHWSGNMLNWATMTSLDEFRQILTGGNRITDTTSTTVLERANSSSQSSTGNFPNKWIGSSVNVSPSTVVGDTPFSGATNIYLSSSGLGASFKISNNSSFSTSGTTNNALGIPVKNTVTTYNAEVQVCVPNTLLNVLGLPSELESNCNSAHLTTDYTNAGVYNKPDGLIQQNFDRIRVGASAYTFLSGASQPNGAVRALLRDNGPTVYNGNAARTTNANTEWDPNTGIFTANPDYPLDYNGTGTGSGQGTAPGGGAFSKSGTINFLNQFGYANGYETNDTIADLYWATLAYLMQVPLDPTYTTGLSTSNSMDTAFPVFTATARTSVAGTGQTVNALTVNDPIQYTCQGNAIISIGDSHTWYDTRVPSTAPATLNGAAGTPLAPLTVSAPGGTVAVALDASVYVTALGNLPLLEANGTTAASNTMAQYRGVTSLGTTTEPDSTPTTYNMAGMAYYAHTKDIRLDKAGNQTVNTYTVDVLEPGPYDGTSGDPTYKPTSLGSGGPNMYWLAAKYGGFSDVNSNGIPASQLTWHTNTSTGTNLRPDNYFPGNRPDLIQSGLSQIFSRVTSTSSLYASAPSISSNRAQTVITSLNTAPFYVPVTGYPTYAADYVPGVWSGDVSGCVSNTDPTSLVISCSTTVGAAWSAQSQLDILTQGTNSAGAIIGWSTGRRIITDSGNGALANTNGTPFEWTNLTASEKLALNSDTTLLNFLRGDRSNEGTKFHSRTHILGDIVNSSAVVVQNALSPNYAELTNPGYTAFQTTVALRKPVVYVGANDGMLHAFEGDFTSGSGTNGGSELFAYVPSILFNGPTSASNALVNGIGALGNLSGVTTNPYAHQFYVDQTPQVADYDSAWSGNTPGAATPRPASTTAWKTLLVGGLGNGGKGIYALDITTAPSAISTTGNSSTSTGEPAIANQVLWQFTDTDMGFSFGRPLIVKTRKYGWVVLMTTGYNNNGTGQDGHGKLYVISAKYGTLLETLDTGAGTKATPSGLTQATGFTQDVTDGTIEQVYAGDLLGNVWRFDLSASTGAYPTPTKLATLTDPSGVVQPITTAPRIVTSLNSSSLGTLRWVFVGTGKFLATSDLTSTQTQTFYALRDGTGPAPSTPPASTGLTRSNLTAVTNLLTGIPALGDASNGWYYDLPNTAGNVAGGATERVVVNPDALASYNLVSFATLIPTSDPCSLDGNVYVVNFTDGLTELSSGGVAVSHLSYQSPVTSATFVNSPNGPQIAVTQLSGSSGLNQLSNSLPSNSPVRVNWREILQ